MRVYDKWRETFVDTIATWGYYTDFEKVYNNTNKIRTSLSTLNALVGYKGNMKEYFKEIIEENPKVLSVVPILLAKRENEIIIKSTEKDYYFNFKKTNYTLDEYAMFMEKNGLFDLMQNHVIGSLYDYVMGVEVGMDTNARKNRTGDAMEDLVEAFIQKAGFVKDENYFKEMYRSEIEEKFGIDLSSITNKDDGTEKRFDFVIKTKDMIYGVECNFYSTQGSKLNETSRSYKTIATEVKGIEDYFTFCWFTDGAGWNGANNNLREFFNTASKINNVHLYNIQDMKDGIMKQIFI